MMRGVHPAKRAFVRRFPAPPPTPEGMVFMSGRLQSAAEVTARAAANMRSRDAAIEKRLTRLKRN
ncbi:MAG: hypothetical protein E6G97_25850 [Alphaproteobacteria bacterium]|nr:MAG: hypothetical protein E6G97_25850 [Alphaproteobacteria bacterium]